MLGAHFLTVEPRDQFAAGGFDVEPLPVVLLQVELRLGERMAGRLAFHLSRVFAELHALLGDDHAPDVLGAVKPDEE